MGMFRYEAIDKSGKVLRGVMNAADEDHVAQNLTKMGYTPQNIFSSSGRHASASTANVIIAAAASPQAGGMLSVTVASGVPVSVKSKVPADKLAMFFRQLATLVKSGRPLNQSMTDVVVRNSKIREILPQIQAMLQSGQQLSGAMTKFPDIFPVHVISSVWSGELSGRLDIALDEIASDFEQEASDTRYARIGWGLTKINLAFFVLTIPASNMVNLLLPVLKEVMKTGGSGVSNKGVLIMLAKHYANSMLGQSLVIVLGMIVFWILLGQIKRIPFVRRILDGLLLQVPMWGLLHKERGLSRFLHVMEGLTSAGINPDLAWDAASLTPRNSAIAENLKLVKGQVAPDAGVLERIVQSGIFDIDDVSLITVGQKTGMIPDVMGNISATYADKAKSSKTKAKSMALFLMITSSLVLSFYVMYQLWTSYVDLAIKAGELMGQ